VPFSSDLTPPSHDLGFPASLRGTTPLTLSHVETFQAQGDKLERMLVAAEKGGSESFVAVPTASDCPQPLTNSRGDVSCNVSKSIFYGRSYWMNCFDQVSISLSSLESSSTSSTAALLY
jgi:hypothetical protein